MHAAINNQATCTSVGGVWSAATCQLLQQPVCDQAQGSWRPQKRDSLVGGLDLLYVGLMQVRARYVIDIQKMVCRGTSCAPWTCFSGESVSMSVKTDVFVRHVQPRLFH